MCGDDKDEMDDASFSMQYPRCRIQCHVIHFSALFFVVHSSKINQLARHFQLTKSKKSK